MTAHTPFTPPPSALARPDSGECAPYYERYIALAPEQDVLSALREECERTLALLRPLTDADGTLRQAPYTWTVRQVVSHMADSERIFAYRALRIARGDTTPLPGFDENAYAQVAERDAPSLHALLDDYEAGRMATLALLRALPESAWRRRGTANGHAVSVRALAWIILGHERHHSQILRSRLA